MIAVQNWQYREPELFRGFSVLPVLAVCRCSECQTGRLKNNLIQMTTKFRINSNQPGGNATYLAYGDFIDTTNNVKLGDSFYVNVDETQFDTPEDEKVYVYAGINTEAVSRSYGGFSNADIQDMVGWVSTSAATSYQTIVSQTGTAAPAVSGGFTPTNTLSGAPTMTWARTGVGVYTLTASAAVFTAGKTGVFTSPLQNLNGSIRAVVTSTTVITITTAVQSLAVLGLLGFTATNTDVLLNGTMIYVQVYP